MARVPKSIVINEHPPYLPRIVFVHYIRIPEQYQGDVEYNNTGINKIDQMLRAPNCPFVLYAGTKKLVRRKEFEEFIRSSVVI